MSIREARITEFLDNLARDAMIMGRIPSRGEIQRKFKDWLKGSRPSEPRMQVRLQGYRTKFDRSAFNQTVEEISKDLSLLFSESVNNATRVLKGINADDIRHQALRYQLAIVDDLLEDLLLNEPSATGYFFGVFDSFNDLSKVDQFNSTADIDLGTGSVRLPPSGGVNKLSLSFMTARVRPPLDIPKEYEPRIVDSTQVAGTKFGYLFDDLIGTGWQHRITARGEAPITISFIFPVSTRNPSVLIRDGAITDQALATVETQARAISKVDLDPLVPNVMAVRVLHSLDGKNWTVLPDHPPAIHLLDKKVSVIFPETLVKFIKIEMKKSPDSSFQIGAGDIGYEFIFGLKEVSLYNSGYAFMGELISVPLAPENVQGTISKLALNVDERVPVGTNVDYYVALESDNPDWQPISSGTRDQEAPKVVEIGSMVLSPRADNVIRCTSTPAQHSTKNGITFRTLYTAGNTPVPRTARLFRGINAWQRKVNISEVVNQIHNNHVVFTVSDNHQKLYLEVENESKDSPPASDGNNPTVVQVRYPVFVDESIPLTPLAGTPRENPAYSIRQVLRVLASGSVGGSDADIVVTGEATARPKVELPAGATGHITAGQYLYIEAANRWGYFKVLTVNDQTTSVDVWVDDPDQVLIDELNVTWSIGYEDITSSVESISENRISFTASQSILTTDRLIFSYRRPLGPEHRLITSSVVVKSNTQGSSIYEAGRDYVVDEVEKAIARLPSGDIGGTGDQIAVVVDFQYETREPDLDTYVAFFYVDAPEPVKITLPAALNVDVDAGERAFIDNGIDVFDITEVTTLPDLPKGWRQVVVKSKPIKGTDGNVDSTAAISKLLLLVDSTGRLVFHPNGKYFSRQTASPISMKETNLFRLQTGIRIDDRGWFALDSNKVVINWDPTTVPDTIRPSLTHAPGSFVYNLVLVDMEEFELQYRYQSEEPAADRVLFKAVLSRSEGTDRHLTPELFSYNIRFSY